MSGVFVQAAALVVLMTGSVSSDMQVFQSTNVIDGCCKPGMNSTTEDVLYIGDMDTSDACEKLCVQNDKCQAFSWADTHPFGSADYANMCYHRFDDTFTKATEPGHVSGRKCPPPPPGMKYAESWCSLDNHPTPTWFQDAKFGIYAHFGPYAVPAFGNEWYSRNMYVNGSAENVHHVKTYGEDFGYKDFIPMFSTPKFNASEWASIYRRAGARYAGPVAEHADGFAMFNSSISEYNAVKMGPLRDITGELEANIRGEGLRFITTMHHEWLQGWYPTFDNNTDTGSPKYELTDTQGGLYGPKTVSSKCFQEFTGNCSISERFFDYFEQKVEEVVAQYHPDVLYFDSRLGNIDEGHRLKFLASYYNQAETYAPAGVVCTYKNRDLETGAGTLDYERGGVVDIQDVAWQTDDALGRSSWSWVNPPNLKNETEVIGELVDIVSKNGNLLLDIPPHADGSIDAVVLRTLFAIGDWLTINGEAIFATRPWFKGTYGEGPTSLTPGAFHEWPIFTSKDFRFTTNGNVLFAMAMAWSSDGSFLITSLNSTSGAGVKVSDVSLLGSDTKVSYHITQQGLQINPMTKPDNLKHVFTFRIHMSQSKIGFLAWDLLDIGVGGITPSSATTLRWMSGGDDSLKVVIEYWRQNAWVIVAKAAKNNGRFVWNPPHTIAGQREVILRIGSVEELDVTHVSSFRVTTSNEKPKPSTNNQIYQTNNQSHQTNNQNHQTNNQNHQTYT